MPPIPLKFRAALPQPIGNFSENSISCAQCGVGKRFGARRTGLLWGVGVRGNDEGISAQCG